ncbi:hypothetical protein EIP91_002692 [Steccherinum ochraceum]|uniref:Protein kinase domain-containing protein n=1 Tax=Steccherinum ochraceum TaxID=92696 RepID=A0A4R0RE99_9APHY|nr:hypothetical protein EIP91_002692 [Steccherinum ochraceum]
MKGYWVGPEDPCNFLNTFLKTNQSLPQTKLSKVNFSRIPVAPVSEKDIYEPITDALLKHEVLPKGFVFSHTPAIEQDGTQLSPCVSLSLNDLESGSWRWDPMEMWVDVRLQDSMDGFRTDSTDSTLYLDDISTPEAKETRRRLVAFALAQLERQHRTFMFSVVVCVDRARFIRWDRAGATVTKAFNIRTHPRLLAEFFWRYGRLSRAERGFDHTVENATAGDKQRLASAISAYLAKPDTRAVPNMNRTTDDSFPCYTMTVASTSGESRQFIIQRPITSPSSPTGRATRAYIALDSAANELVFLKDYWRPVESNRHSEAEVYAALADAHVPHTPHVRMAGDVPQDLGESHTTLTQTLKQQGDLSRCGSLKAYRHHRVVQDIAFSLSTVRNSRELVAAIRDIIETIAAAHKAGWLHRDVSSDNVMLDNNGNAILNDWDHALSLISETAPSQRTGTWLFMSALLAKFPERVQNLSDDLESCYWVLLYNAFQLFASDADHHIFTMFDFQNDYLVDSEVTGGSMKVSYIHRAAIPTFTCAPLQQLMDALRTHFRHYYALRMGEDFLDLPAWYHDPAAAMLRCFDDALARTDWPASDVLAIPLSPHSCERSAPRLVEQPHQSTKTPSHASPPSSHERKRRSRDEDDQDSTSRPARQQSSGSKRAKTSSIPSATTRRSTKKASTGHSKSTAADAANMPITRSRTRSSQRVTRSQSRRLGL